MSAADKAEQVARAFHETYEWLAPQYGYETRRESAKRWEDVPENNRALMIAVARHLLNSKAISAPSEEEITFSHLGEMVDDEEHKAFARRTFSDPSFRAKAHRLRQEALDYLATKP